MGFRCACLLIAVVLVGACGSKGEKPRGALPGESAPPSLPTSLPPSLIEIAAGRDVRLPVINGTGGAIAPATLRVAASPSAAYVGDEQVIALAAGALPAGSGEGLLIEPVTAALERVPVRTEPLQLLLDRDTPYRTVMSLIVSAKGKRVGITRFEIIAQGDGGLAVLPLELPTKPAAAAGAADANPCSALTSLSGRNPGSGLAAALDPEAEAARQPAAEPAEERALPPRMRDVDCDPPVVAVLGDELQLFSMRGQLGTLREPALRERRDAAGALPFEALARRLREHVAASWPDGTPRPEVAHGVILMLDDDVPAQVLVEAMHAARGTDAEPLFPDVVLSSGFR